MERDRTYFYGFIVGVSMILLPIPRFFFWAGVMEHVETFFRYFGFVLFVCCGIPLVVAVVRQMLRKLK